MLDGPTLLDAAMGTALQSRGLAPECLPEEWVLSRPEAVAAVHASHAGAGAEVLLTCTFGCSEPRLAGRGMAPLLESICLSAVRLARSAGPGLTVAGCLGPTGLVRPGRAVPASELREAYERAFRALRGAGVDLLWSETHYALEEARAALAAARATGLPAAVTMAFAERGGELAAPDGAGAGECLRALAADGAAAVGVNCVAPSPALARLLGAMAGAVAVPLVVKPNAGPPGAPLAPAEFAAAVAPSLRAARLAGGCCGTAAEHLRALAGVLYT